MCEYVCVYKCIYGLSDFLACVFVHALYPVPAQGDPKQTNNPSFLFFSFSIDIVEWVRSPADRNSSPLPCLTPRSKRVWATIGEVVCIEKIQFNGETRSNVSLQTSSLALAVIDTRLLTNTRCMLLVTLPKIQK